MISPDLGEEPDGATPLGPDDIEGLIPTWVATRGDLNIAEQSNIARALEWASSRRGPRSLGTLLTDAAMRELHRRMFADVWKWAGHYRQRDTNIGAHWPYIPTQMRDLLGDVRLQTADLTCPAWPADELAVRFHYRLVLIHPFANGNGRHARLAADLLAEALGGTAFTWGANDPGPAGSARERYLNALRDADASGEFEQLVRFARS